MKRVFVAATHSSPVDARRGRRGNFLRRGVAATLLAFAISACQTPHEFTAPDASWKTQTGQLKYTSGERVLIGEVVVSRRGTADFQIEFQKAGGFPLLKLRMDSTTARAEGILARGSWQGAPDQTPKPLRGWVGLREAFAKPQADRFSIAPRDSEDRFDFVFSR